MNKPAVGLALALTLLLATTASASVPPPGPLAPLKALGIPFERAKLAIKPEKMRQIGARSFEGHYSSSQHILLLLFTFESPKRAEAAQQAAIDWATRPRFPIIHYERAVTRGEFLLLLGTSTEKPLAPETAKTLDKLQRAFKGTQ